MIKHIYVENFRGNWAKYNFQKKNKQVPFINIINKEDFPPVFSYEDLPVMVIDSTGDYLVEWQLNRMGSDYHRLVKKLPWVALLSPVWVNVKQLYKK